MQFEKQQRMNSAAFRYERSVRPWCALERKLPTWRGCGLWDVPREPVLAGGVPCEVAGMWQGFRRSLWA